MADLVHDAALRWALLRRVTEHLKRRRETFDACPREQYDADAGVPPGYPCWKQRVYSQTADDEVPLPRGEWCPSCLTRQTYHDALVLVVPMRAGAQRGLFRRCRTELSEAAQHRLKDGK